MKFINVIKSKKLFKYCNIPVLITLFISSCNINIILEAIVCASITYYVVLFPLNASLNFVNILLAC